MHIEQNRFKLAAAFVAAGILLSSNALAESWGNNSNPFISGQSLKKGFHWYDDQKPEEKAKPDEAPQSQAQKPEDVELNSEWLKENLTKLQMAAMNNPTDENLSRYYTANRLMLDISSRFAVKSKQFFLQHPFLSETKNQPVEKVALDAHRQKVEANTMDVMKVIFQRAGLWFFYRSDCQFCAQESEILEFMKNYYGADILPISTDGRPLFNGRFQDFVVPTIDLMKKYDIREVPTLYLVTNDGQHAQKVSEGLMSADELKNTIIVSARGIGVIDEATFQSTLDVRQNFTVGDTGVIKVSDKAYEQDPYLLQKIMQQKLEGVIAPTAEAVSATSLPADGFNGVPNGSSNYLQYAYPQNSGN